MVSEDFINKRKKLIALRDRLDVQADSAREKLRVSGKTGQPAHITAQESHVLATLEKVNEEIVKLDQNPY
jgi:hypothetical protein